MQVRVILEAVARAAASANCSSHVTYNVTRIYLRARLRVYLAQLFNIHWEWTDTTFPFFQPRGPGMSWGIIYVYARAPASSMFLRHIIFCRFRKFAIVVQIALKPLMSLIRHHIACRWRVTDRQQTLHACRGRLLPGSQTHVNVHPGQCHAVNCPRQKRSPRNIRGSRNWSPLPRTAPTTRIRVSVISSFFQCY